MDWLIGFLDYLWGIVRSVAAAGLVYLAVAFTWDGLRAAWRAWLRYYRRWPS